MCSQNLRYALSFPQSLSILSHLITSPLLHHSYTFHLSPICVTPRRPSPVLLLPPSPMLHHPNGQMIRGIHVNPFSLSVPIVSSPPSMDTSGSERD